MSAKERKLPKTFRLSPITVEKLKQLSELMQQDATSIIELAVEHYFPIGKALGIEQTKQKLKKFDEM